jgi:hypothetical protein
MLTQHENTPVRRFDEESANPRRTIYPSNVSSLAYTLGDRAREFTCLEDAQRAGIPFHEAQMVAMQEAYLSRWRLIWP